MATILKSESASTRQAQEFNIQDIREQAEQALVDAKEAASQILAQAKHEAQQILQQARDQGLEDAKREIDARVAQEAELLSAQTCHSALDSCQEAMDQVCQQTSEWLLHWRKETIAIAIQIAEHLIGKELASDNTEILARWLASAFDSLSVAEKASLRIHPSDAALVSDSLAKIAASTPFASRAELVMDASIERGGCTLQTDCGYVDMQLSTQLKRLAEELQ